MRLYLSIGLTLMLAVPAAGNPSTAALAAGGLELTTTSAVKIKSEDLYISPQTVRARYEFRNESERDVDTTIAFPLPDVDRGRQEDYQLSGDPSGNLVDFVIMVDGKPVKPIIERRALVNGRDVTQQIKAAGLDLFPSGVLVADGLSPAALRKLESAGIIGRFDEKLMSADPKWVLRTTVHWQQRFAAHAIAALEVSYKPITGFWTPLYEDVESDKRFIG